MLKKIFLIVLIICSVLAVNFNVNAANASMSYTMAEKIKRVGKARKARKTKTKRKPSTAEHVKSFFRYYLLYIPNRLVDVFDIFSLDFKIGDGFWAEMQTTRYAQIGGSNAKGYFMTKGYNRQYGFGHKEIHRFGLAFWEHDLTIVDDTIGSVKEYRLYFPNYLSFFDNVANRNLDAFASGDVDFWKIGGNLGWYIGFGFGMHPIEVADLITGIFFVDISEDDF